MKTHRNWFTYIYLTFFGICLCFSLFGAILNIGISTKYPFLWYGGILLTMGGLWLILNALAKILSRFNIYRLKGRRLGLCLETVLITAVLIAAGAARLWIVRNLPVQPESDFKTYYEIAKLLSQGTLKSDGAGYCDYISQFPHVIGYPYVLSLFFKLFGASVATGLYVNLAAGLMSIFFVNRIARLVCGSTGGILAAALAAFWPSQILFINQMASEPLFMCLSLLCIWIAAYLFKASTEVKDTRILLLNVLLGILLAAAGGVRPVSVILLIAILICTITYREVPDENSKPGLIKSCVSRGWIRVIFVFISFLICSQLISGATAHTIGRKLPGSTVSFGYNLMVGLNTESRGAWNEKDAKFLTDRFTETDSAQEAHKASLREALKRVREDPERIADLVFEKYTLLWANDDYGAYWNLLFLEQQHKLTVERKDFINAIAVWNNIYYIICMYLSLITGIFLWFRKNEGTEHILVLYFVGTAFLHMLLESQGRYHYNILPVFAILASAGISEIFKYYRRREKHDPAYENGSAVPVIEKNPAAGQLDEKQENTASKAAISIGEHEEEKISSDHSFDILDAIRNGHVTVTVTEAYLKESGDVLREDQKE